MLTQWRTGPRGLIGLDYNVLEFVFNTRKIEETDRPNIFDGVQIMERAVLDKVEKR